MITQIIHWLRKKVRGRYRHSKLAGANRSVGSRAGSESRSVPTTHGTSMASDAGMWLDQAKTFSGIHDWKQVIDCATKAINRSPDLVEAYVIRAEAQSVVGETDQAIIDYSTVIRLDPQNGSAWMMRGACKTQKASKLGRQQAIEVLNDAHPDCVRACEIMPDNATAAGTLLGLEIDANKYREAVATAGAWWNRSMRVDDKLVLAWLSAIAFILADKPPQKWACFREFLELEPAKLNPAEWSVAEMNRKIRDLSELASSGYFSKQRLSEIINIHETFLSHFPGDGPMVK